MLLKLLLFTILFVKQANSESIRNFKINNILKQEKIISRSNLVKGIIDRKFLNKDNKLICEQKFEYPQFEGRYLAQVLDNINKVTQNIAKRGFEYCNSDNPYGYFALSYKIIHNNDKRLTIFFNHYSYLITNQSTSYSKLLNFDLTTGKLIRFDQLIGKDSIKDLNSFLIKTLSRIKKSYYYNNLNQKSVLISPSADQEIIADLAKINFYFKDQQLVIVFNPYDVGPLDLGMIEIIIPDELMIK